MLEGSRDASSARLTATEHSHGEGLIHSAALSQRRYLDEDYRGGETLFPENRFDEDRQQVDLREMNSWRLRMHEVETPELLEVQLVNAIAPYILNARLKPLMLRTPALTSTSSTSARSRDSSIAPRRPTSTRTPTWRKRR